MLRTTKVKNGIVRGIEAADARITAYKGIPFAAPPIGKNRWRAPQPAQDWEGERDCSRFAPIPVQDTPGLGTDIYCREWHVDPEIPMDEDCLYLNVWTPAKKADEKLPVLVWIYGGAFQWGYAREMEFDGERIARRGIVVVTVNYRLGVFGFLAHKELSAEQPETPSNFGLLDQKAAIRWVYDNIAAFGGDPEKITVAGQSAGGGSVSNQITDSDNFGIIKGAIIMSGMIWDPFSNGNPLSPGGMEGPEKLGDKFLEFLGVGTIDEARKIPYMTVRDKYAEFARNGRFWPSINCGPYKSDPYKAICEGKYNNIPLMSGFTYDEFRLPLSDGSSTSVVEYSVQNAFNQALMKNPKAPLYFYCFDPDIPGDDNPGTFHSVDLWFWFETLAKDTRPFCGRHYELARQMCDYLCNFVKTGNPNGDGLYGQELPEWQAYDGKGKKMFFTGKGAQFKDERTDFTRYLEEKPRMQMMM
ncbi:MAG: carboxylesterase family protein [Lachnospiraceae bacterium]|nr:carboxylesterase family protein [Lachnospiraceae bacterium]